jgi:hypothetical protein
VAVAKSRAKKDNLSERIFLPVLHTGQSDGIYYFPSHFNQIYILDFGLLK